MLRKYERMLIMILVLIPILFGCANHRHERRPHGARLSEAMQKASDDYQGKREIESPAPSSFHDEQTPMVQRVERQTATPPAMDEKTPQAKTGQSSLFGIAGGVGAIKTDGLYELNHFDISLGSYMDDRQRLEGYAGFGWALIDETDELNNAIDNGVGLFNLGLRYKYFTTRRHTFLGHYLTCGLAYSLMFWDYENAISLDGETIHSDNLEGFELYAGMGFHLAQTKNFQIGVEVLPSIILWENTTYKGFDNDVFDTFYMLKVRLTFSLLNE